MAGSIRDQGETAMVKGLQEFIALHDIEQRDGGKLVFYKAVSREWGSLWVRMMAQTRGFDTSTTHGAANVYRIGMEVRVREWNTDRSTECGLGLHVGTKDCAKDYQEDGCFLGSGDTKRRLVEVLVDPKDVVCVPFHGSKIRCKRLVVAREIKRRN
jgi:hypothetical protein